MFRNCLNFPIKNRLWRFFSCNKIRSLDKSYFFFNQKCFNCLFSVFSIINTNLQQPIVIQTYNNHQYTNLQQPIVIQSYNNHQYKFTTNNCDSNLQQSSIHKFTTNNCDSNLQQSSIQIYNNQLWFKHTIGVSNMSLLPYLLEQDSCFLFK